MRELASGVLSLPDDHADGREPAPDGGDASRPGRFGPIYEYVTRLPASGQRSVSRAVDVPDRTGWAVALASVSTPALTFVPVYASARLPVCPSPLAPALARLAGQASTLTRAPAHPPGALCETGAGVQP